MQTGKRALWLYLYVTCGMTAKRPLAYEPGGWGAAAPRLGQNHYFSGKS